MVDPGSSGDTVAECICCRRWFHPDDIDDFGCCAHCDLILEECVRSPDAESDDGGVVF